jgi:DNA-binding CsgD family transcriptional regulator
MDITPAPTVSRSAVERGREFFQQRMWGDAYRTLSAADREAPLDPEDLERLGIAAQLIGNDAESEELLARVHQEFLARGDAPHAARAAVWMAMRLLLQGKTAPSAGWVARARRVLEGHPNECVERGYVLLPDALKAAFQRDAETSHSLFTEISRTGERFADPELMALGRLGQGRALIRLGQIAPGMALLDEVMVAVTADKMSPVTVGEVYCAVLDACQETFDLGRAQEWTSALERWCAEQPEMTPYRGPCMVRRAELLQLHGDWRDAVNEAARACDRLSRSPAHPAAGAAFYQRAEVHRLRGEFTEAEECYREVSRRGRDPHPGLALLRLAQGRTGSAAAAIRRMLEEAKDLRVRAPALAAGVEILLAVGDTTAAQAAAEELGDIARTIDAPLLRALAAQAMGAVLLTEGELRAALSSLREAVTTWRGLDAPYQAARARLLIGLVHRALGDEDTAALDLDAARHTLVELGALVDLQNLETTPPPAAQADPSLTAREIEVLRLVVTGRTNRAIAQSLGISEKTVARHLSNMFTKLGVTSRAAATSYAYQHNLVQGSH